MLSLCYYGDETILTIAKPQYNKVTRGFPNFFSYNEVLLYQGTFAYNKFYNNWSKETHLLYRGLCYTKVRYMKVPL